MTQTLPAKQSSYPLHQSHHVCREVLLILPLVYIQERYLRITKNTIDCNRHIVQVVALGGVWCHNWPYLKIKRSNERQQNTKIHQKRKEPPKEKNTCHYLVLYTSATMTSDDENSKQCILSLSHTFNYVKKAHINVSWSKRFKRSVQAYLCHSQTKSLRYQLRVSKGTRNAWRLKVRHCDLRVENVPSMMSLCDPRPWFPSFLSCVLLSLHPP